MNRLCSLLTALTVPLMLAGPCVSLQAQESAADKAVVELREEVILQESMRQGGSQIKLGDIARITDRDSQRRSALQNLDLAACVPDQQTTVDRSQVEIRILLAGFEPESVRVQGAARVMITPPPEVSLTDLGVERAVFESLCRQFSIPEDDLRVKLISPFVSSSVGALDQLKSPRLELVPTPQLPLGRTQLTIRILEGSRVVVARQVSFEIARRQPVVVAANSLERGSLVGPEHVREEMRFVDGPMDRLTAAQVVGRKVLLPFRPDEVVTLRHVGTPDEAESPILVQPRDAVRLIARKRGLTVTIPVAEALQAGRQGQLIRVRNVQSNQVVTGVVAGRGEVHVILP